MDSSPATDGLVGTAAAWRPGDVSELAAGNGVRWDISGLCGAAELSAESSQSPIESLNLAAFTSSTFMLAGCGERWCFCCCCCCLLFLLLLLLPQFGRFSSTRSLPALQAQALLQYFLARARRVPAQRSDKRHLRASAEWQLRLTVDSGCDLLGVHVVSRHNPGKTLPLPCVSTASAAKTVPFLAVAQGW